MVLRKGGDVLLTDEACVRLQSAIIVQAVQDYKKALKNDDRKTARQVERFFRSEWGQLLSMGNGEAIIERVRKEAKENEENNRNLVRKNREP